MIPAKFHRIGQLRRILSARCVVPRLRCQTWSQPFCNQDNERAAVNSESSQRRPERQADTATDREIQWDKRASVDGAAVAGLSAAEAAGSAARLRAALIARLLSVIRLPSPQPSPRAVPPLTGTKVDRFGIAVSTAAINMSPATGLS